jgi:hypothetical protein
MFANYFPRMFVKAKTLPTNAAIIETRVLTYDAASSNVVGFSFQFERLYVNREMADASR